MTKMSYIDALKEALNQSAIKNCRLTRSEIEQEIEAISDQLRGPMSNDERLMLVADRSELRATLKAMARGNEETVRT